jgi:hypothetical protein
MVRLVFIAVFLVGLGISIPAGATAVYIPDDVELSVYPNPFNAQFTIEFEGITSSAEIVITDVLGKVIYSTTVVNARTVHVDLAEKKLTPGVYILNLKSMEESISKRIVKR